MLYKTSSFFKNLILTFLRLSSNLQFDKLYGPCIDVCQFQEYTGIRIKYFTENRGIFIKNSFIFPQQVHFRPLNKLDII